MPQIKKADVRNLTPAQRSEIARIGGKARWNRLTPEERSQVARNNLAKGRAMRSAACAARRDPPAPRLITDRLTPAQIIYRAEKNARLERDAVKIAEARVQFDAVMAAQVLVGRGGRPRGKSILVGVDPADALIQALERSGR